MKPYVLKKILTFFSIPIKKNKISLIYKLHTNHKNMFQITITS